MKGYRHQIGNCKVNPAKQVKYLWYQGKKHQAGKACVLFPGQKLTVEIELKSMLLIVCTKCFLPLKPKPAGLTCKNKNKGYTRALINAK